MRIAVDIDSTLSDFWSVLERIARARFGLELPYDGLPVAGLPTDDQWGNGRWGAAEAHAAAEAWPCHAEDIHESSRLAHTEPHVREAVPYPYAADRLREWSKSGHEIHVLSKRPRFALPATQKWLERQGIPFDACECELDKVPYTVEHVIDLLVDDHPVTLLRMRRETDVPVLARRHPWNSALIDALHLDSFDGWTSDPLLLCRQRVRD